MSTTDTPPAAWGYVSCTRCHETHHDAARHIDHMRTMHAVNLVPLTLASRHEGRGGWLLWPTRHEQRCIPGIEAERHGGGFRHEYGPMTAVEVEVARQLGHNHAWLPTDDGWGRTTMNRGQRPRWWRTGSWPAQPRPADTGPGLRDPMEVVYAAPA
jgi:hypothetical protein